MTRISCDVVADLMPLVLDGLAGKDTEALLHEHLASCEKCRERYAQMQQERREETPPPAPLQTVKRELHRRRLNMALAVGCVIAFAAVLLFGWMTKPQYGDAQGVTLMTREDGRRYVLMDNDAICFQADVLENPDLGGTDMIAYSWTTRWDRLLGRNGRGGVASLTVPEDVKRVYYADLASDGGLIRLSGEEDGGGAQVLPRLAARAYVVAGLAGAAVFAIATMLLIQRSRVWRFTALAALFCLSVVVNTLLIIGPGLKTYTLTRDLTTLILPGSLFMTGGLVFGNRVRYQRLKDKGLRAD